MDENRTLEDDFPNAIECQEINNADVVYYYIDDFKKICRDSVPIFYAYYYWDEEEYFITERHIDKYKLTEIERYKVDEFVKKYNSEIEEFCLIPYSFKMLTIYQGIKIVLDPPIVVEEPQNPTNVLEDYIRKLDTGNITKEEIIEEFKKIILEDEKFRKCTNQTFRRQYINDFVLQPEHRKFCMIFKGFDPASQLTHIADTIYAEYKNECKYRGIKLGEPL